jgi:hypothetical protein
MTIPRAHRVQLTYSGTLNASQIPAKLINGFSGYSIAVESLYIYATDSIYNIGNGMAIDVSLESPSEVYFPNITNGIAGDRTQIFARVPLSYGVATPPPEWEDGGFVSYQNPCPYESRTKMILKVTDVDYYVLNLLTTSRGDDITCSQAFITLIFYDESTGNEFIPPGWV